MATSHVVALALLTVVSASQTQLHSANGAKVLMSISSHARFDAEVRSGRLIRRQQSQATCTTATAAEACAAGQDCENDVCVDKPAQVQCTTATAAEACAAGQDCENDVCVDKPAQAQCTTVTVAEDCAAGQDCENDVCVDKPAQATATTDTCADHTTPAACAGASDTCEENAAGECVAKQAPAAAACDPLCTDAEECQDGLCVSKTAVKAEAPAAAACDPLCTDAEECQDGLCVSKTAVKAEASCTEDEAAACTADQKCEGGACVDVPSIPGATPGGVSSPEPLQDSRDKPARSMLTVLISSVGGKHLVVAADASPVFAISSGQSTRWNLEDGGEMEGAGGVKHKAVVIQSASAVTSSYLGVDSHGKLDVAAEKDPWLLEYTGNGEMKLKHAVSGQYLTDSSDSESMLDVSGVNFHVKLLAVAWNQQVEEKASPTTIAVFIKGANGGNLAGSGGKLQSRTGFEDDAVFTIFDSGKHGAFLKDPEGLYLRDGAGTLELTSFQNDQNEVWKLKQKPELEMLEIQSASGGFISLSSAGAVAEAAVSSDPSNVMQGNKFDFILKEVHFRQH